MGIQSQTGSRGAGTVQDPVIATTNDDICSLTPADLDWVLDIGAART